MAKYDLTNAVPFNEQPLYKQGYEDAIEKACQWLKAYDVTFTETPSMLEDFRRAMEG